MVYELEIEVQQFQLTCKYPDSNYKFLIPFFSPHSHGSNAHNFVLNSTVCIEIYRIYYASTSKLTI